MKFWIKTIFYTWFLCLTGCGKNEEPQTAQCGCESEAEAITNNVTGIIEYDSTEQPIFYRLQGYYATGLEVCNDSTFQTLLAQNKIMNGDSVVFGGEAKNTCRDCEFCGFISITTLTKK